MPVRKKDASPVKLTIWAELRHARRVVEVPAEDLAGLDDRGREKLFDDIAADEAILGDMVGWGWDLKEGKE